MAVESIETPKTEEKPAFNAAEWIKARNEGKQPPPPGKPAEEPAATKGAASPAAKDDDDGGDDKHPSSRSQRREANRLREQLGYERGRAEALQQLLERGYTPTAAAQKVEAEASGDAEKEPTRAQFQTDAEYYRAIGRFEARQTVKEEVHKVEERKAETQADQQFQSVIDEANAKFEEDVKSFPDWEEVKEKMFEVEFDTAKQGTLFTLIAASDIRAKLFYHWGKNPDSFQELLKLSPAGQIKAVHRLEGRLESMYNGSDTAAQAGRKPVEDRKPPEKPAQGRPSAVDRDIHKPRPSTEVAAKGGSATPEEPKIGSAAWMAARNARQFGR